MTTPTLTETVDILQNMDDEYARLAKLTLSTMQHLLAQQYDAVSPGGSGDGVKVSGGSYDNAAVMLARAAALDPYAYRGRKITDALTGVNKSLREWQRAIDQALSDTTPKHDDRPRCPGTVEDGDGRLGGCGNLTEKYITQQGVKYLPLCKKCRTQGKH